MRPGRTAAFGLLVALALWGVAPVVVVVVRLIAYGDVPTGADGPLAGDQLQYLAWVRDAGSHVLASNLFELGPSAHVYAHPMFTLSGLLWWLGAPVAVAYLVWKPVAIGVVFAGAMALARRLLPGDGWARVAATALALFSFSPLAALVGWAELGTPAGREDLLPTAGELFPAGLLWGYMPTCLAVGLMPAVVLAAERSLDPARRAAGRGVAWYAAWGAAAGALVSWLHPWQGVTLLLVLAGLGVWPGGASPRARLALLAPAAGVIAPLAYYAGLARWDSAWHLAQRLNDVGPPPLWAVVLAVGPLALAALPGLRRPGRDVAERALVLWPVASVLALVTTTSYPVHVLEGISLPLAVLAVRGWRRLRLPAAAGAGAVALLTVPGAGYVARQLHRTVANYSIQQLYLSPDDADALSWVADHGPRGGVLAPPRLGEAVPSQTGRHTWVGHPSWTSDYRVRVTRAVALFEGRLSPVAARAFVRATGARVLIADCASAPDLAARLGSAAGQLRRFGCVRVYAVARAS